MIEPIANPAPYYDVEWLDCIRCGGTGESVECYDDLCHAQGSCMHGDNMCALCGGIGLITAELAGRWRGRDAFEGVTAPDADLRARGTLHAVVRERRQEADSA
jgi:hypothetical protein